MPQEVDISWQVLREIARDWTGDETVDLTEVKPLAGGCISTALALSLNNGKKVVLKITPHRVDRAYADEEFQLRLLRQAGVPVPEVYRCKTGSLDSPNSYLLMEFVEGVDLGAAKTMCSAEQFNRLQAELAKLVLKLHEQTSEHYMRVTADSPKPFTDWASCYRDIFDPIQQEVDKANVLPVKARKQIGKLHDRLDRYLVHDDRPRLLHWDIWATNVLARPDADGNWHIAALLDPNCKFAHAEAELAYLELFQTATPTFLKTYQQTQRLSPDYHRLRKPIYQLYSLLNHLRLFGQEYLRPVCAAVDRVGALV